MISRRLALAGALLAIVALAAPLHAQDRIPAPEGWISTAPTKGRLAAIKHPATLGHAEVARLTVPKGELDAWRADLLDRLQKSGMTLEEGPDRIEVGGKPALKTTLSLKKLDRDFQILLVETHEGSTLTCVSAVLKPNEDNPIESLQKGVLTFFAAALQ